MSEAFDVANEQVRFFLNDLGNVQVGSFHPRQTTVGALGIDSRMFTMLSNVKDKDMCFTLQRELSDSIAQAILKTGVDVDGQLVGQTPIVELYQLASAFPRYFDKYPTFEKIPEEDLREVRHTVPVHFYSQEQVIRSIGPEDICELGDGLVEIAIPVEIGPYLCEQEFELNGKLKPYSFEIPGISGVVYIIDRQEKYLGKPASFEGLDIKVPGFPVATLTHNHLAQLCLIGEAELDFTSIESE